MKKILMILIGVICLTACSNKKIKSYTEITYEEFKQKIENKESFPLFVGSHNCSHCDDYKISLNSFISDYQVDVFYIDVANLETEEYREFLAYVNFSSTPTTVFIIDGEEQNVYNRIVGAKPYGKIVAKFQKMGYIKEK